MGYPKRVGFLLKKGNNIPNGSIKTDALPVNKLKFAFL